MTITLGYATLAQVNYALAFTTGADTSRDAILERQVGAVSRAIDNLTARRFYGTAETRYYTADSKKEVNVDDLTSISTGLYSDLDGDLTYSITWAGTDYLLWPFNAALDGWPYDRILLHPKGRYFFPIHAKAIKVSATFGFCATGSQPSAITEACILATEQLFKRKDAIFGVTGPAGFSYELKAAMRGDPHLMALIGPYMKVY